MPHTFRTDRPIEKRSEDSLDRKTFSVRLADDIAAWSGAESLVIGLHADWGHGKSSVKNMAVERLTELGSQAPRVIEFNPWMVSGETHVAQAFFQQVGETLADEGLGDNGSERAAIWRRYSRYFTTAAHVATTVDTLLPLVGVIPGIGRSMAEKLRDAAGLAENAASHVDRQEKSFDDLRRELRKQFSNLKRKLLVVVDDLDRLTDEEIRLMIRVVKASADFPNIVYLLVFQKEAVARALDPISGNQGKEFLKKIVQVDLELPYLPQQKVAAFWEKGVTEIFGDTLAKGSEEALVNYWFGGLSGYFRNLRDVTRFLNSLAFVAGGYRSAGTWEVNVMDLIVVESLRVFEPAVYRVLSQNRHLLTSYADRVNRGHLTSLATSLVQSRDEKHLSEDQFRGLVGALFPVLQSVWGNMHYGGDSDFVWIRKKRVCTEHFFDRYFCFALPEGGLSEAFVVRVVDAKANRDLLRGLIREVELGGRLFDALKRLEAEDILFTDPSMAYPLALSDRCDEWPEVPVGALALLPGSMFAQAALNRCLASAKDDGTRRKRLLKYLRESQGFLLPASSIGRYSDGGELGEWPVLEEAVVAGLKAGWVQRVIEHADTEQFFRITDLFRVILYWMDWGDKKDVLKWVAEIGSNPERMTRLLASMVSRGTSQTDGSYYVKRRRRLSWKNLEAFGDRGFWEAVTTTLTRLEQPSAETSETIRFLKNAMARWERGIADSDPIDDDDSVEQEVRPRNRDPI